MRYPEQAAVNRVKNAVPGKSTDIPYPGDRVEPRNAIVPGTDRDLGPDTEGIKIPSITEETIDRIVALSQRHLVKMLMDKAFDFTHPFDEYAPQGNPGPQQSLTVQSDYDMPERIDSILVVIPVGATNALLQLGQRTLQLYTGAALAAPLVQSLYAKGIILNSDDPRILTFVGTITSQGYLGLTGFALTRGQFS